MKISGTLLASFDHLPLAARRDRSHCRVLQRDWVKCCLPGPPDSSWARELPAPGSSEQRQEGFGRCPRAACSTCSRSAGTWGQQSLHLEFEIAQMSQTNAVRDSSQASPALARFAPRADGDPESKFCLTANHMVNSNIKPTSMLCAGEHNSVNQEIPAAFLGNSLERNWCASSGCD